MIQYYIGISSEPSEPFTLLIDTLNAGTPVGFTIPIAAGGGYLYDVDWGDGITTTNHTGSATHTYAVDGVYQVQISGTFPRLFFNNGGDKLKVIDILNWGQTGFSTTQTSAFFGLSNLTEIPTASDAWYNSIINGLSMFRNANLTYLPSNMTLDSLIDGSRMFQLNDFTLLPSGMILGNLTDGSYMFYLTNLQELPSTLTLASLTNGYGMFRSLSLTDLPTGITLANLTDGTQMFEGNTINTTRYSQLLIDMNANNSNNNVIFHGGNSKYNAAGETARNALIARGWTITDGGLEV